MVEPTNACKEVKVERIIGASPEVTKEQYDQIINALNASKVEPMGDFVVLLTAPVVTYQPPRAGCPPFLELEYPATPSIRVVLDSEAKRGTTAERLITLAAAILQQDKPKLAVAFNALAELV